MSFSAEHFLLFFIFYYPQKSITTRKKVIKSILSQGSEFRILALRVKCKNTQLNRKNFHQKKKIKESH